MTLTNIGCKNALPKEKTYKIYDAGGLYLDVRPNGNKYFRMKYFIQKLVDGKSKKVEKVLSFGSYPKVSLSDARRQRDEALTLLERGLDPSEEKKKKKGSLIEVPIVKSEDTVEAIARDWFEKQKGQWALSHQEKVKRRLEKDIFPYLGNRILKDIKPLELLSVIQKMERRGATELSHKVLQYCGRIWRYAVILEKADRD